VAGIVVIGAQWGDEGKGKIIDVFADQADFVVRYQGGANAGHTLVVDGKKTVLHLVPSGILQPKTVCVIAPGVVLDVEELLSEIKALRESGSLSDPARLLISESCTVILPYHRKLDQLREAAEGNTRIGTTGKGIGPAYEDRAARKAITFGELFHPESLEKKITEALREKNFLFENLYKTEGFKVETILKDLARVSEELAPYRRRDTSLLIHKAIKNGKRVLFEGAQGTLLDILHGTYPFVTSSSTVAGSACTGSGVGPGAISKVIGITKAYATRVGEGPFPTELNNEKGEALRSLGAEFGATTGRPRRCGWLDLVALKYAIRINGISNLALMKLDVLSGMDEVGVCTAYRLNDEIIAEMPTSSEDLAKVEPVIEFLPGWKEDLTEITTIKDLPRNAREYINYIGNELGTPVDVVSVGPGRSQTLWIKPLFN
jgi:adenylosuccinate synthase